MKSFSYIGATAVVLMTALGPATAQSDYPSKPVQLIAGYPGGGKIDSINRLIGECSGFEGDIVAVPKPGAGGTIASAEFAKAAPDGYKLLLEPSGVLLSRPIFTELTYSHEDFEPIATVGAAVTALRVLKDSQFSTWAELEAYAKENPGALTSATSGVGSFAHLSLVTLAENYGIEITHVPFPSGREAMAAAVGGHVDMFVGDNDNPELVPLVTTHTERVSLFADTPTFAELGYDGMDWVVRVMMIAPKGTPEPILDKWETVLRDVVTTDCYKAGMDNLRWVPMSEDRDSLIELWPLEFERNKAMIEALGKAYYQQ
jgi:tripartite-type tricarboxylate transporter receptor subunit TctC